MQGGIVTRYISACIPRVHTATPPRTHSRSIQTGCMTLCCPINYRPMLSFGLQDRPVIIARTQFIREHRLYEVVSVWSDWFASRSVWLTMSELHTAWCFRMVSVFHTAASNCFISNDSCSSKDFNILQCCWQLLHILGSMTCYSCTHALTSSIKLCICIQHISSRAA